VSERANGGAPPGRIVRHAGVDRAFHWLAAVCVLVLLGSAFLPIVGVQFSWLALHWITGLVLIALLAFHLVRALFWQRVRCVLIRGSDVRDAAAILRTTLRLPTPPPRKPGKYSFAQKLVHLGFAVVLLTAAVTGALMLASIDTPWWRRNPYWLSDAASGAIYVLHDLAALVTIPMVMVHVYFALRPEKRQFLRAMARGWITRGEFLAEHDPQRWRVDA
jgi:cytochrome b subunit of formate dehydrogenase